MTGASGFIGSRLCTRLVNSGAEVHGITRGSRGRDALVHRWWKGDLADPDVAKRLLTEIRPDQIVHLASCVMGSREIRMVEPTFRGEFLTTMHVLSAATELGCERVLIAGSMDQPRAGTDLVPGSPYAAAKSASGLYARMFHALYDLPAVILRVFMTYGPGQRDGTKLLPYVTGCFARGESPKLTSGGRPVDWVYVDDVVEAFSLALRAPGLAGRTIDVGSGRAVPVRDVVEKVRRLMQSDVRPSYGALPDRPFESTDVADLEEAQRLLRWEPRTPLDQGLERAVAWYEGGAFQSVGEIARVATETDGR